MFNRPNKTSFKPKQLSGLHTSRKLVVDKVIAEEHASSSTTCQISQKQKHDSSFRKQADKARASLETALASIKNLPAHDNREGIPPSYKQEYTQSIRTLDRIIRHEWNQTITTYLSALEPSHSSPRVHPRTSVSSDSVETSPPRSPSPLPPRLSISSDSVEF